MKLEGGAVVFKIVDETYQMKEQNRNPETMGYIEGYTSNTVGHKYLRINCKSIPDQEIYDCYKRTNSLGKFEYKVGEPYGEGVRLNKKQVLKLIFKLIRWLVVK